MLSRSRTKHHFRFQLIRFLVIFLFIILAGRLVYVQGVLKTGLQKRADRQFSARSKKSALRNKILDRHFQPLAETVKVNSCYVDPKMAKDKDRTAKYLSNKLDVNYGKLKKDLMQNKTSFMWVKRNIPPGLNEVIKENKMPGVGIKTEYRRHYPQGIIGSHVLGLVGVDDIGLSGVEMRYQSSLSSNAKNKKSNLPKGHIQLTIDSRIQKIVEKELAWGVDKTDATKGMIIVQNPRNGHILAMASWPPLSLNPDNPPMSQELRIPPIVDVFEPGSTFKAVTAAAAMEENIIKPNETWFGENGAWPVADITIHDRKFRDWYSFEEVWMYSSNIGAAKIAERLGNDRLYQYARSFGFGVFPGSGVAGEAKGLLRPPRAWSGVSKYVISFGQEVGVTALQLVGAYSAIANGGELMEPKVIKSIVNDDNEILWRDKPIVVRRVISEDTAQKLTNILVKVVDKGSGINAKLSWNDNVKVAGKTGTAQKFDIERGYYRNDLSLVSFIGFLPANKPEYTILVILDESEGQRWGGIDAAPVFRRIADQLVSGSSI